MKKRDKRVKWADNGHNPYFEEYKAFTKNSASTYWKWMHSKGLPGDRSGTREYYTANPDQLTENAAVWKSSNEQDENKYRKLMREAVDNLTTKQKRLWDLCMRGRLLSIRKASKLLRINVSTARDSLSQAKASVIKYLREYGESKMDENVLPCPFCYAVCRGTAKRSDLLHYHLIDNHGITEKEAFAYIGNAEYPDVLLTEPMNSETRKHWFTKHNKADDDEEQWYDYKA